jgi:hypothetical protein
MTNKKQFTKTIYYAFVQELEVPADTSEEEIDDLVFQQFEQPVDYIWSDQTKHLFEETI